MPNLTRFVMRSLLSFLALLGLFAGCSNEPEIPRVKADILADIRTLPALYRTPSGKEVEVPQNAAENFSNMVVVDHDSGELAWRVWECHNPECPGKTGEGPYLFICPWESLSLTPDGTLPPYYQPDYSLPAVYCPDCMEIRDYGNESSELLQRYSDYVTEHVLPSSAARKLELEAELRTRIDNVNERLGRTE